MRGYLVYKAKKKRACCPVIIPPKEGAVKVFNVDIFRSTLKYMCSVPAGADQWAGGGGVSWGSGPPPPRFGGQPNFMKREKTSQNSPFAKQGLKI